MDGRKMKRRNSVCFSLAAGFLLLLAVVLSVRLGSVSFTLKEFMSGLFGREGYEKIHFVLWNLRIPRTLAAICAGVGLSVSGLALQNITGNELAGPNIIGVNAGAGFFVITGMYFLPEKTALLPVTAFAGAFFATALILLIGGVFLKEKSAVILAGVAVTALLNAGISLISRLDTDLISIYNDFAVGGLSGSNAENLVVPAIMIAVSFIVIAYFSKDLDAMMLGDDLSGSLGVNVRLVRFAVIFASSAAAGAVVSFAGLLGFVGLIVPHMARRIIGVKTKAALTASAILGSIVVLFADTAGRSAVPGTEIPVGIVMAFVGVPFFLYLIIRRKAA